MKVAHMGGQVHEVEGPNLLTRGRHLPVRLRGRSHRLGTAEVEKWSLLPQDASAKTRVAGPAVVPCCHHLCCAPVHPRTGMRGLFPERCLDLFKIR